jgi:hypothetical protein
MNGSRTPSAVRADRKCAERLEVARRLYQALVAQDPNRVIILRDGDGKVIAHHDLQPEHPEIA